MGLPGPSLPATPAWRASRRVRYAQAVRVEDFEVVRELGRGGMGVVYEAIEEPLGRRVALKLLHPEFAARPEVAARFADEARNIAKLSHPGIVRIHRVGSWEGQRYLALEYVEGESLDAYLARQALPLPRVLAVLSSLAQALGHAHDAGVVHRNLKPGNVFLRKDGSVVLGDFGIAKTLGPDAGALTRTGDIIGTPAYMSPEQAAGLPITPASDVYALGVVAFELIAGRVPFTADAPVALLTKHLHEPAPPLADLAPSAPRALAALVAAMLEKAPARRPQNGAEVDRALAPMTRQLEVGHASTALPDQAEALPSPTSALEELDLTVACFHLVGFASRTCQTLLPARVAFLLESWYRLARVSVRESGGVVDRYVADRVTALFGFPLRCSDHVQRALRSVAALQAALAAFNRAHDLVLEMRASVVCGTCLAGSIAGDAVTTSVQGPLVADMAALVKTEVVDAPIRVNRAAFRRASGMADFTRFEEPRVGEAWATAVVRTG